MVAGVVMYPPADFRVERLADFIIHHPRTFPQLLGRHVTNDYVTVLNLVAGVRGLRLDNRGGWAFTRVVSQHCTSGGAHHQTDTSHEYRCCDPNQLSSASRHCLPQSH